MKQLIRWFYMYLEARKVENKSLQLILQNTLFKINIKKNTSLVLFCIGFPFNSRGKRTITWEDILIFTEKRGASIRKFLKESKQAAKEKGLVIEDYFDELIYTFKLSDETIKFDKRLIQLIRSIGFRVVKGKSAKKYLDLVDEAGNIRLRGTKAEIEKYASKIAQGETKLLNEFNAIVKHSLGSKQAFNPLQDALKPLRDAGVYIKKSALGLVPDFTKTPQFLYNRDPKFGKIKIKLTGVDPQDFKAANKAAGFDKTPGDYTWHHMDDYDPITGECTMQLVLTEIHEKTCPHKGGAGLWMDLFDIIYKNRKKTKR